MNLEVFFTEENSALLLLGLLFLGLAYYYRKNPPKKINHLYGYRTRRSMANQEIWDFANTQNAKDFWRVAIATMITGVVLLPLHSSLKVFIQLVVLLLGLGIAIWHTEKQIDRFFDKNGNKKP
ncbi:SdpI family protein [uncultured Dokdonia sp.]|uniref:SdpI family protein n=1 Tax=uncultured Dokdonia sp. TaxID=575653 RepID=UPI00260AB48D|nr:SdpI family protein [uncultured Dokdonia sp.]